MDLKNYIHHIANWPKPGIDFKDISPLLADPEVFRYAIDALHPKNVSVDFWVGIESRGFLLASALSSRFSNGLIMIRKKGKLPPPLVETSYALEYGTDVIQMHSGSGKVVIVDDVLATGGTLKAAHHLCEKAGFEVVGHSVLIDLTYIHQQKPFYVKDKIVHTVIKY